MTEAVSWVTPLLILPGVGLLIMSTAARYEAIHAEIHELLHDTGQEAAQCAGHVLTRARLLRTALVALYAAASSIAASALVAALVIWRGGEAPWPAWALLTLGVACVLVATATLTRESVASLRIMEDHAAEIARRTRAAGPG